VRVTRTLDVMSPLRPVALLGALLACCLSTAGAASAATTRFAAPGGDVMAQNDCTTAPLPCSLSRALAASATGDAISLAPGSYDLDAVTLPAFPLNWQATSPDAAARPVLASKTAAPAIDITATRSGSTFTGVEIDSTSPPGPTAFAAVKVEAGAKVAISDSTLTGRSCVDAAAAGAVAIDHSQLTTSTNAACVTLPVQSTLRTSTVARGTPLSTEDPPPVVVTGGLVEDTKITGGLRLASPGAIARRVNSVGGVGVVGQGLVTDSVARGTSKDEGGIVADAPHGGTLRVVASTAIGMRGLGLAASDSSGPQDGSVVPNTIVATDTIARGDTADIGVAVLSACDLDSDCKAGRISIDHSDFATRQPATPPTRGADPITIGEGNISADPQFADAEHFDYHLLPGSPAIDAGISINEALPADADVNARDQGSAPDIGAYETTPPVPVVPQPTGGPGTPGPTGPGVPPPAKPVLSALTFAPARFRVGGHGGGTKVSFTLSQATTVKITFERLVKGRAKGATCSATLKHGKRCTLRRLVGFLTFSGAHAGVTTARFSGRFVKTQLAPGSYYVTAAATGGNTTRPLRLTVLKAKRT
jgi:hypothetical protein